MKSHGGGIMGQQLAYGLDAQRTARFVMSQAIIQQNHELAELAVSDLVSLANYEQIKIPARPMMKSMVRLDQLRASRAYFITLDNHISKELGAKWVAIRAKYAKNTIGLDEDPFTESKPISEISMEGNEE